MRPELAAILWTALVLLWVPPGMLGGIVSAIALFEVFYLLSSLPIAFLQQWPILRPSSVALSTLAAVLLTVSMGHRLRRRRQSPPTDRNTSSPNGMSEP